MKKYTKAPASSGKHVVMILDESGSMASRQNATVSGFDEYIAKMQADLPDATFTLMRFDSSKQDLTHKAVPIKDVGPLTNYQPGQMTPLYDAIGKAIKFAESLVGKVFVTIITDGQENASREFNRKSIFDIIAEKERQGWAFSYLGIHADAWDEAQKMGVAICYTAQPDSVGKAYELSNTYAMSYFKDPKDAKR